VFTQSIEFDSYLITYTEYLTMADRSRSRSPDRGAPPADQAQDYPPQNGADQGAPADNSAPPVESGEEVKLYVGNLDYGKFV
jgi:hypothetical protein